MIQVEAFAFLSTLVMMFALQDGLETIKFLRNDQNQEESVKDLNTKREIATQLQTYRDYTFPVESRRSVVFRRLHCNTYSVLRSDRMKLW